MKKIPAVATAIGISLLLTTTQGVLAASNTKSTTKTPAQQLNKTVYTLANLNSVKITAKSTVRLTDVNILTQSEENILTYTLTIANGDSKSLDLLDYWSKVKTNSGVIFSTSLMTKDKTKKTLSAGSSTTLTYVAKVGKNVKISDMVFQVIKWDFNQTNYESLKGQFKIPATYITSTPADQSKTLKMFNTPLKAKVNQFASYTSGDYNYVSIGLNIQNIGYNLFEDPKLKFAIKTASGTSYPMSIDSTSSDYKIQPQDNKTLNLMAEIPKSVNLKNLELQLIQDDETSKLSLPIATMQLPSTANQSLAIQPNIEKFITLGSGKISVKVSGATILQSFGDHELSVRFNIRNTSGSTVTIPKYQFEIHTSDGYKLPISTSITDNLTMQPLEERTLNLSVTVPANVNAQKAQLFMNLPTVAEAKDQFNYPVGIFALPEVQPLQNMIGQTQFVQTNNGILGVTLSSIQRLPWTDGDLVSAKITVNNTGYKTIQLPNLTAELKIDNAKISNDTKLISSQSVGLLGANMSTDFYVVSKIPSYLDFSQIQVSVLEKLSETDKSQWVQFGNSGSLPDLNSISMGSTYNVSTPGHNEEIKVLRSFVYTGTSSDLIYTEIEAKNMEDRQIDLSQFAGTYIGSRGQTYKATVSQIETSVGPEEKSLITLWAKIPKNISTNDMKLIIGQGITDSKFTAIKEVPTGYVNAATLELGVTPPNSRNTLQNLDLFPYSLTLKNVIANMNGSTTVDLSFDYDQTKNMDYSMGEFGHKYLFEVVDSSGRSFEKEFSPESDLKVMSGGRASFAFSDIVFQDRRSGSFTLNVYDLFQGQKIKLGSQSFYYYSSTLD